RRGIELLRYRHEARRALIEAINELGEIEKRAAEPVHFIEDYAVHAVRLDILQQEVQRRSLQTPAAEAAVVVVTLYDYPPELLLALDIGFGGFALGVQRIELPFESLFRRLTRVDGAADAVRRSFRRSLASGAPSHFDPGPIRRIAGPAPLSGLQGAWAARGDSEHPKSKGPLEL